MLTMASLAKKIKTKLSSTKHHGRYALDNAQSTPKVLLQNVSHQVDTNTNETLYSDSGGFINAEKRDGDDISVTGNGFIAAENDSNDLGDKVEMSVEIEAVDKVSSAASKEELETIEIDSDIRMKSSRGSPSDMIPRCQACDVENTGLSSQTGNEEDLKSGQSAETGKSRENDTAQTELISYENLDGSVKSTIWYIHTDSDSTSVETSQSSDLPSHSLTDVSAPFSQGKASAIWYDSETESRAAVRTSIDSGYEKSPDPTLEPSMQSTLNLLPDISSTSTVSVSDDLKSKNCIASKNLDSSSVHTRDRVEICQSPSHNSDGPKLDAERSSSGTSCSRGENNASTTSADLESDLVSSAGIQIIPNSKNLAELSCRRDSEQPSFTSGIDKPSTQISAESGSGDLQIDPGLRSKPLASASVPGEDTTGTPVVENVLCSSVATTRSTTPGRKYSPAVDDWGNSRRQMQEMAGKNSSGNSGADNSLQNTRNVVVMVPSGIPENFSQPAETANYSHSMREGLSSSSEDSIVMIEVSSRGDKSCIGESDSGYRQTHIAKDSEVLLYITEDEEDVSTKKESAQLSSENLDEKAGEMCKGGASTEDKAGKGSSKDNQPVMSTDPEINEIVKNYDNVFFKKTGNKCIACIGDEPLHKSIEDVNDLEKETKILNLDSCRDAISENPSSFLASHETVSSTVMTGFVQLPDKELGGSADNSGQQSDENNLESFDEPESDLVGVGEKLESTPSKWIGSSESTPKVDISDKLQNRSDGTYTSGHENDSKLDSNLEISAKLDSSMESQGDVPLIIFEMDEDKIGGVPESRPVPPVRRKRGSCCCSCHTNSGPNSDLKSSGNDVTKKLVTRSSSDEPMKCYVGTGGLNGVGSACSSLSEPAELNNLGQDSNNPESVDHDSPKTAGCSEFGANLANSLESSVWNNLSGNLDSSAKPCSCPELSLNNLDSPPPIVDRRQIADPLPPVPPFNAPNIPQTAVSDASKATRVPKFGQFACGHKVPLRPAKPEQTGKFVTSSGLQNETYAMLKDVRVEKALTTPRVRNMRTKPAAPPSGKRGNSMYCDNRTYIDTCDINVGGSTACNCDSGRSRYAPSRKTLDDVPPPVPKRNYSLYSTRTRPQVREDTSSSDSDSSSSANSLDNLPNLNRKKHAIPNEYIDSDEFPRSPASNEDLRRWEDALSLPTEPEDPESATLFHIHNSICDMCRLRGQGKKLHSPSKQIVTPGLRPLSSGSLHPLCFNRDDVKFIRTSGQQLDPGTGRPINPLRTFYDSDSESDSGIGTEIPKSRSSSSGEMTRFDRYSQNVLKPNTVYAQSQKTKSLPQNFANKTYISDAIFHESTEKSGLKKDVTMGIPGQKPPPVPKRNYSSKHRSMIQAVANNPPPPVPRTAATQSMKVRSFSDEDLVNEPIHMSLQEMGREAPAVELRASEERKNRPDQLLHPSSSRKQQYMRHSVPPGMAFVDLPPLPKRKSEFGKTENTDSSDDSSKDKPPHVPPREKKKNPLSALFKPKQKLGNIFHWKSKEGKEKTSQKLPHRKLPPLPQPEQEVIFCPEGEEVTTPTYGACGGLKDIDKGHEDGQNSSNFIESLIRLREVGWYWGPLNLEDAEAKLTNKKDGSFLVRDSSHDSYILSLSFRSQGKTHHTRIEHCHGTFGFWSQPVSHGRMSIIEFIERAMEFSRNGKFLYFLRPHAPGHPPSPVALLYPISRFEVMQSLQHTCRFIILKHVRYDHIEQLPLPGPMKRYLKEKQYFTEKLDNESEED